MSSINLAFDMQSLSFLLSISMLFSPYRNAEIELRFSNVRKVIEVIVLGTGFLAHFLCWSMLSLSILVITHLVQFELSPANMNEMTWDIMILLPHCAQKIYIQFLSLLWVFSFLEQSLVTELCPKAQFKSTLFKRHSYILLVTILTWKLWDPVSADFLS